MYSVTVNNKRELFFQLGISYQGSFLRHHQHCNLAELPLLLGGCLGHFAALSLWHQSLPPPRHLRRVRLPVRPPFTSSAPAPPAPAPRHPIYNDHITNHIKFLLNPADHNYHKWKSFFLMVLVRYGVTYLIDHPPPPNADAQYLELYAHVALWIYATLADPLVDHVVGATTTYAVRTKIKDFFLANRAVRFMILNRQYGNLKQGDLSVTEYARRMKLLTDGLADIDHAVTEVDLTTQFSARPRQAP